MKKIAKREFLQAVVDTIKMVSDVPLDVCVADIERNNGKYDCIRIKCGQNTYTKIGVDSYYQMFCDGNLSAVANAAEAVIQSQKNHQTHMDDIHDLTRKVTDYEWAKDMLRCRLVNTALNHDMLGRVPSIPFQDLSIIFYLTWDSNDGRCVANVTNNLCAQWEISTTVLFRDALANMQAELPVRFQNMFEVMADLAEATAEDVEAIFNDIDEPVLYVLTNKDTYMGAAVVLYPGVLESCAEKMGGDFYLIPSSIHEFLVTSLKDISPDELQAMIQNINQTNVPPEEVLGDHAYLYSAAQKKIIIV